MDKQHGEGVRRTLRRTESGNTYKFTEKKISNWKTPGHDGIHEFWFKKFIAIYDRLALEMNRCLQEAPVPKRITKGRTTFIQKDPRKRSRPKQLQTNIVPTYDVKIVTAQIREEIYFSLTSLGVFLEEQKGCRKRHRGTGELLYIDQHILNESKTPKTLAMAWIDYKKA